MRRVLAFLFLVALAAGAGFLWYWLSGLGFTQLKKMRELERVPPTTSSAVLPGETNLRGRITPIPGRTITAAPGGFHARQFSGRECVYFRWRVEKEKKDSKGRTSWETVDSGSKWAPVFLLSDNSGDVLVALRRDQLPSFNVREDRSHRSGIYRYTEWRLDPGDKVFCFGYASRVDDTLVIQFPEPDAEHHYTPLLSQDGEVGERRSMATGSIFACWGGLVALSLVVVFGLILFRVHRIYVYLVIVALILVAGLSYSGGRMMYEDLTGAHHRVEHHRAQAVQEIRLALAGHVDWTGDWDTLGDFDDSRYAAVPEEQLARARRIRIDLWRAINRTNDRVVRSQQFPESLISGSFGIEPDPQIFLPDDDQQLAAELDAEYEPAKLSQVMVWIVGSVGVLLAFFMTKWGFDSIQTKRHIEHMPTTPSTGAAWGPLEVAGKARMIDDVPPLTGPLTGKPCVQYHYLEQERRGSGKNEKWVTLVDSDVRKTFAIEDAEGRLAVNPVGAEIITRHHSGRTMGRRRYTETRLEPGDDLYILGYAVGAPPDHASLQMTKSKDKFPYIIANIPEEAVMMQKARTGLWVLDIALCASVLVGLIIFGAVGSFQATDYLWAAVIAPAYLMLVFVLMMFNDLVFLRNRVRNTWSNIDVALKKRFDLIPNLEAVVKQYMAHERNLHEKLAMLRTKAHGQIALLPEVSGKIEDYPELKADANARHLMQQLIRVENDIALMRQSYNQAVERYNTKIHHFPEFFLAFLARFKDGEMFTAGFEVRQVPSISFDDAEDDENDPGEGDAVVDVSMTPGGQLPPKEALREATRLRTAPSS